MGAIYTPEDLAEDVLSAYRDYLDGMNGLRADGIVIDDFATMDGETDAWWRMKLDHLHCDD